MRLINMRRRLLLSLAFVFVLIGAVVLVRSERLRELPSLEVSLWPHPQVHILEPARVSHIRAAQKMTEAELAAFDPEIRAEFVAQRTGICALHQAQMQRRWLRIEYGLALGETWPSPEEAAKFPHGAPAVGGGCVVTPTREIELFRCAQCEQAYRAWAEQSAQQAKARPAPVRSAQARGVTL